jgi:serine/threonine protein kinase/WD40 repeat protein
LQFAEKGNVLMARPAETKPGPDAATTERDERLGEAIEDYLTLAEAGSAPHPDDFASRYPDLKEDLKAALDGLAMVQGLVGESGVGAGGRLEAGRRIAGYRIVRELGRGGMGIVYEAVHVDLDRPVALKVLGMHAAPDSTGRRRFLNEAKTAAGLHHTHIVPVFDVGQLGGLCYYAMQRIEGCGLDRVVKALRKGRPTGSGSSSGRAKLAMSAEIAATIDLMNASAMGDPTRSWFGAASAKKAGGPVPNDERSDETPPYEPPTGSEYYRWVARVGQEAADALSHAHGRGVIHRDIKPSNLLVDGRGTIWVADFGLARRISDPSVTQTDSLLGTPRYMSPEQAVQGPIDVLTDVYSLGATLYELLTLRPPHDGRSTAELIGQIRDKEPIAPRKIDPKLPRDLETIVLKAMGKRTSDRYDSAGELADDLGRYLATQPVKARRIGPIGRSWRFAQRHPSIAAISTIAIVSILTTATIAYVRVVDAKNKALTAQTDTQRALDGEKAARRELKAVTIQILWRDAKYIRQLRVPDLRRMGLARLKEAVDLNPDAAMTPNLRAEAVQFLALRDIEPKPILNTGPTAKLTFVGSGDRLATLSLIEGVPELDLWDVGKREKMARHPLPNELREGSARGGGMNRWFSGLDAAGTDVAVIRPGGDGVRVFDTSADVGMSPAPVFTDLFMPGRVVTGLALTSDGRRLVTISMPVPTLSGNRGGGPGGGGPGGGARPILFRVSLWDTKQHDAPMATLAETEPRVESTTNTSPPPNFPRFPIVAVSPDGKTIALAWSGDQQISLRRAEDGADLGTIATEGLVSALALSKDGTVAAACSGTLSRWDVDSKKPLPGVSLHQPFVRGIRFSHDGTMLAAWGGGSGVEIWDPEANTLLASLPTAGQINDLVFAPDGRTMAASVGNATRVWTVVDPIGRTRLAAPSESKTPPRMTGLAFSPSGALASTFIFPPSNGASARLQCPGGSVFTRDGLASGAIGFDPEGRLVLPTGLSLDFFEGARETKAAHTVALPIPPAENNGMISARDQPLVFGCLTSADGRTMALIRMADTVIVRFGGSDSPPTVTSIRTNFGAGGGNRGQRGGGTPPSDAPSPPGGPGGPPGGGGPNRGRDTFPQAISPSGDRLYFIAGAKRELRLLSLEANQVREVRFAEVPKDLTRVAVSQDGRSLALGHSTGWVSIISARDGTALGTIPAPSDSENDQVTALAFSKDNELAIGTKAGTIRLWSVRNPKAPVSVVSLPNHSGEVKFLTFAPQGAGQKLAAGDDLGADIWDLELVRKRLTEIGLGW